MNTGRTKIAKNKTFLEEDIDFLVTNQTKSIFPDIDVLHIKNTLLGKRYQLSIVCLPPKKIQDLNIKYRQKDYIPNILSFPYDEKKGEIFLQLGTIKKQMKKFHMSYPHLVGFMLVHGMLHLKGYDHGPEMEVLEESWSKKLGFIHIS